MIVLMVAGGAAMIPSGIFDPVRPLTATIAGEMAESVKGSTHYRALFALAVVLLAFTFALNMLSEYFLSKAKKRAGGKK